MSRLSASFLGCLLPIIAVAALLCTGPVSAQSPGSSSVQSPNPFNLASPDIPSVVKTPADQLATAINDHDLPKVTALLQSDPTLAKTPSSAGIPPLLSLLWRNWNSDENSKQILQKLLDSGADINQADLAGKTPLIYGAMDSHVQASSLLMLLDKGADVNAKDLEGRSALWWAVESGDDVRKVNLLISRKGDVNSRVASTGGTLLHLAVTNLKDGRCPPDMIDVLLNAGANVNARNNCGNMPLHLALRFNAAQFAGGAMSIFSLPHSASRYGWGRIYVNPDLVRLVPQLMERGAQINASDQFGLTPLMLTLLNRDKANRTLLMQRHAAMDTLTKLFNAAAANDTVTLAHLIRTLPDVKDLRASNGATALDVAALWNAPGAVKLLLRTGSDPSARDAAQETPLHYASSVPENTTVVNLLLAADADPNAEDMYGQTPLHLAVETNSLVTLQILLGHKASPDLVGWHIETALILAITRHNVDMAEALINAGANVNAYVSLSRETNLLDYAIETGSRPLVALLLAHGADVNYIRDDGSNIYGPPISPLVKAIFMPGKNNEILRMLLDRGADVKPRYNGGQTVLDLARSRGNQEVVELLIQHGAK